MLDTLFKLQILLTLNFITYVPWCFNSNWKWWQEFVDNHHSCFFGWSPPYHHHHCHHLLHLWCKKKETEERRGKGRVQINFLYACVYSFRLLINAYNLDITQNILNSTFTFFSHLAEKSWIGCPIETEGWPLHKETQTTAKDDFAEVQRILEEKDGERRSLCWRWQYNIRVSVFSVKSTFCMFARSYHIIIIQDCKL